MAYDWLRSKRESKPMMRLIWRNYVPQKHSFVLWLTLRGRLNTKDNWFFQNDDDYCVFYIRYHETISHLVFRCTFVNSIWRCVRRWLNINKEMNTLLISIKWIKKDHGVAFSNSKAALFAFAATVYMIWR